jgi:hypothetical protein
LKVYNILAIPSLLYGCEIWISKQSDMRRLKTPDIAHDTHSRVQFIILQKNLRYFKVLKVDPVKRKSRYKPKWLDHVNRMEHIKYPKQLLDYRPIPVRN